MNKYIVFRDIEYYPYIVGIFDSLDDASKMMESYISTYSDNGQIFLCEIIKEHNFEECSKDD